MKFFEASELDGAHAARMAAYDSHIRERVGPGFAYPLRMRDWELDQVLGRLPAAAGPYAMLDTGSFNTYLGLWLARIGQRVVVSDLFGARLRKSLLRQLRILPRKPTEAPYGAWRAAVRRAAPAIEIRTVDLTAMPFAEGTFDVITSVSVVEHIPAVERALSEMYRCLKPGGRLLLTIDCSQTAKPYADGVRYFSPDELDRLMAPYPVVSERRPADFRRENWCYGRSQPVLTGFVEIAKPGSNTPFAR